MRIPASSLVSAWCNSVSETETIIDFLWRGACRASLSADPWSAEGGRPLRAQWADARRWLSKADEDIRSADLMLLAEPPLVEQAAFHSAEKIIKGLLVAAAISAPRTHDVERLADLATPSYPALRPLMDELVQTTAWNAATRYPDLPKPLPRCRIGRSIASTSLGAATSCGGSRASFRLRLRHRQSSGPRTTSSCCR